MSGEEVQIAQIEDSIKAMERRISRLRKSSRGCDKMEAERWETYKYELQGALRWWKARQDKEIR